MATEMTAVMAEAQHGGASARLQEQAVRHRLRIAMDDVQQLRFDLASYGKGAAGEERLAGAVVEHIQRWHQLEWRPLFDRHWPGTRSSNIDLVLVGPPGVVIIDAKAWGPSTVKGGHLWCGEFDATKHVNSVRYQAHEVDLLRSRTGIPAGQASTMLVLINSAEKAKKVRGTTVVGLSRLSHELVRKGTRLTQPQITELADVLDQLLPPNANADLVRANATEPCPRKLRVVTAEVMQAAAEAAARGDIESWMSWLHPDQATLTATRFAGPARLRGPAGTGKTVVALHRAHVLAHTVGDKVLMLAPTKTLSAVHKHLFARLAPQVVDRVEFATVTQWCVRYLKKRQAVPVLEDGSQSFANAWANTHSVGSLAGLSVSQEYWRDEIRHVIKGRGLSSFDDFLGLERRGRRVPLNEDHRRAVWDLFENYERDLNRRGVWDWDDVVGHAIRWVGYEQASPRYTSVIVDEVQDLSLQAVRLVGRVASHGEDGLLLVGDGRQQVFPGGYRLIDAGITVPGARSIVLDSNYRNASNIMQRARTVLAGTQLPDLDDDPAVTDRRTTLTRPAGTVSDCLFKTTGDIQRALRGYLTSQCSNGTSWGAMAILVPANYEVDQWMGRCKAWGIPAMQLSDYDGRTTDRVKVGTYDRAKGLEFSTVMLPGFAAANDSSATGQVKERNELRAQRLYVAMTRAVDCLWIGQLETQSPVQKPDRNPSTGNQPSERHHEQAAS